jgi:hypothetical protein
MRFHIIATFALELTTRVFAAYQPSGELRPLEDEVLLDQFENFTYPVEFDLDSIYDEEEPAVLSPPIRPFSPMRRHRMGLNEISRPDIGYLFHPYSYTPDFIRPPPRMRKPEPSPSNITIDSEIHRGTVHDGTRWVPNSDDPGQNAPADKVYAHSEPNVTSRQENPRPISSVSSGAAILTPLLVYFGTLLVPILT